MEKKGREDKPRWLDTALGFPCGHPNLFPTPDLCTPERPDSKAEGPSGTHNKHVLSE